MLESVEIELAPDFEEPLDNINFSPIDDFSEQHDNILFLLNHKIDTPSDNLSHQDSHVCEKQCQDYTSFIHAINFSHKFALPQFMAQLNCEEQEPTDNPVTVSTFI